VAHEQPYEALEAYWLYRLGIMEPPFPAFGRTIPAGRFEMGEQPGHAVTFVQPFFIGKTEVTFAQYNAFCDATGRARPSDAGWGGDDRPVIYVDWNDARAYAQWLDAMTGWGCRLPSEAEWEYAARAGTKTNYALPEPSGSDDIAGKGLANCRGCGSQWDGEQTAPVASFPANAWGMHDMHGNVWEWTEDCWHDSYDGAPNDGRAWGEENGGDCSYRVLRGGSWGNSQDGARSANRFGGFPSGRIDYFGFRVVCLSPSSNTEP
jgi:formylglycine-generating enzyme required for sulfatase activity